LLIGLADDRFELKPAWKFAGQLLIAYATAASGTRITLFIHNVPVNYLLTIFWILALVNAFNFMDNMNGLCSGLGMIAAGHFAFMAALSGEYLVAAFCFLVTGCILGFFPYNFPKAKTFLGDSGSHLIGYLVAVLAILPSFYSRKNPDPLLVAVPLLVLAVPLYDLAYVVLLRWKMGKPFYVGDTNHLSHRLVRSGRTKVEAVLIILGIA
jgi:UDP-GlcNAc:undecaprenyl-phosphate GlcNAc-1-phosphate transferase